MAKEPRRRTDDLRDAVKLVVQATTGVTDVVEDMHRHIASGPAVLGQPLAVPARLVTTVAYGSVRGVTRLVGKAIDRVLRELEPVLGESAAGPAQDAVLAALNGVLGDWLEATKNPLAIPMRLRQEGAGPKVAVFVHGSSMNDRHWRWQGHDYGEMLARDHGWAPVYVRYNTGLPIAENGRRLAAALEALPSSTEEIAIVGHSMGGLVARVAAEVAKAEGRAWRSKLRTIITLGSPHHGSPIERGGHLLDIVLPLTGYSAPLARLGKLRSAGITDLRHGIDVPLPEDVACYAVAAGSDRLVPQASAFGSVPEERRTVIVGASHVDLLGSAEVYAFLCRALGARPPADPTG